MALIGFGGIELRPQQPEHPVAVEQFGGHPLRFQLAAEPVDVRQVLTHRPAMSLHGPLQRCRWQPAAAHPRSSPLGPCPGAG